MNPVVTQRRSTSGLFWGMVVVSLVLHAGFIGVWIVASQLSFSSPMRPPENIIKTKLVRLGKKRDESLLPRKVAPPAPPKSKKTPNKLEQKTVDAKPTKESANKPKSASEILQNFEQDDATKPDLSKLINQAVGEVEDEGHEDGSKLGEVATGRLKATYNDKINQKVKSKFKVPQTLTDQERVILKAVLLIKIDAVGRIKTAKISRPSGNASFDNAVVAAAKKASPLPPPPKDLRDFYAGGVRFNMCPISCS